MSQADHGFHVCKFGGTSVANSECIRRDIETIRSHETPCVVVVSAMGGITNMLIDAAQRATEGHLDTARATASVLRRNHEELIDELFIGPGAEALGGLLREQLRRSVAEFEGICESLAVLREKTPRILDVVVARGERLLAQIFARAMVHAGVTAEYVDATEVLHAGRSIDSETAVQSLSQNRLFVPDEDRSRVCLESLVIPKLAAGVCVVIPGFIASGQNGEIITLGRGGSDYSATIIASIIGAQQVTLYKEVDGLLTADPRLVPDARVISHLHYREASELAFYGAKVLHPRTIIPLLRTGIPLRVRNSFRPEFPGTVISADSPVQGFPVKALTAIENQALITIQGNGMMGVPGIAGRTFLALAQSGLSTSFISQASSESSICFVVPGSESPHAIDILKRTFRFELDHGLIDDIASQEGVAIVAVVGQGMKGHAGVAARTMRAVSEVGANIIAIAQGSSELNISIAIEEKDKADVLRALHREYRLHEMTARPERREQKANLFLYGFGQIGRTLAHQLTEQAHYLENALHLDLRITAVADRTRVVSNQLGFSASRLDQLAEGKVQRRVLDQPRDGESAVESVTDFLSHRDVKGILIDCTAAQTYPLMREAVENGWHLALANKKPLAVDQNLYDELFGLAADKGLAIRYEATVGAGLPVLDTLAKLRAAGDTVSEIEGCFSGSLGFIVTRLCEGIAFSDAVREAHQKGYTEPDPRDDLSGVDVARKALILARSMGRKLNLEDIEVESLFEQSLWSDSFSDPHAFIAELSKQDRSMRERVESTSRTGCVLRYVARITNEGIRVGFAAVPNQSPMARLVGTDNQVLVRSRHYTTNPLVVSGPGAGAEVTSAGVLGDVVTIAQSESWLSSGPKLRRPAS